MERIWLKQYPAGVPSDIDVNQYTSLVGLLEESFKKFADRKAFICMDKSITYRELDEMSLALGAYLQSKGLAKGDRVALMMPNVLQYPVAIAGVLRAGFTVVNVNPLYTPRELEHQLNDSGAEAIVVLENFASTRAAGDRARPRSSTSSSAAMGDLLGFKGVIVNLVVRRVKKMVPAYRCRARSRFNDALAAGTRHDAAPAEAHARTTSPSCNIPAAPPASPRARRCSTATSLANVVQSDAWLEPALEQAADRDQMIIVTALPLYHIFALTACFLLRVRIGGTCLLIANPRDIPGFVKTLKKYQVTCFPAVNTLYNALLNHPGLREARFLASSNVVDRRRHGDAGGRRRAWKKVTGRADRRRLWPVGDLAGR